MIDIKLFIYTQNNQLRLNRTCYWRCLPYSYSSRGETHLALPIKLHTYRYDLTVKNNTSNNTPLVTSGKIRTLYLFTSRYPISPPTSPWTRPNVYGVLDTHMCIRTNNYTREHNSSKYPISKLIGNNHKLDTIKSNVNNVNMPHAPEL